MKKSSIFVSNIDLELLVTSYNNGFHEILAEEQDYFSYFRSKTNCITSFSVNIS